MEEIHLPDNLDDGQLSYLLWELMGRMRTRHPDTELILLSLPKNDPPERQRILRAFLSGFGDQ